MNIRDHGADRTRGEILQDASKRQAGWLGKLIRTSSFAYLFDSRLHRTTDFSDLTFDGKASPSLATLRTLAERYRGRPLAGVLLLTDGCATDLGEQLAHDLSDLPPVYPVVIGRIRPQKDLALTNVTVSQTSFEDAPVTIQADVEAAGFAGRTAAIDLLERPATRVERQQWKPGRNDAKQTFRFRLRPDRSGVLFYRLRIADDGGRPSRQSRAVLRGEATLANNAPHGRRGSRQRPLSHSLRGRQTQLGLKFLKRAIEEDEQVQLVGLIRVAKTRAEVSIGEDTPAKRAIRCTAASTCRTRSRPSSTISPSSCD